MLTACVENVASFSFLKRRHCFIPHVKLITFITIFGTSLVFTAPVFVKLLCPTPCLLTRNATTGFTDNNFISTIHTKTETPISFLMLSSITTRPINITIVSSNQPRGGSKSTSRKHFIQDPLLQLKPYYNSSKEVHPKAGPYNSSTLKLTSHILFPTTSSQMKQLDKMNTSASQPPKLERCCWLTWDSVPVAFILALLSALLLVMILMAVSKWGKLRKREKMGKEVSLLAWFRLVCRPLLGANIFLKWFSVMIYCVSPPAIYSAYVMLLLTPPAVYVIASKSVISKRTKTKSSLFTLEHVKKLHINCNQRRSESERFLIEDEQCKNEISLSEVMLQIEGPMHSHVTNDSLSQDCYNEFVKEQLEELPKDKYLDAEENKQKAELEDEKVDSPIEDNACVVTETRPADVPSSPLKCASSGENRSSVFDDSDYDDVIDFMMSSNFEQNQSESKFQFDVGNTATDDGITEDDVSSSKRSSALSGTSSMTSGVESGDEKPSKYAELDIAKILHTRKRIHRILQVTPSEFYDFEACAPEPQSGQTSSGKKKSHLLKRNTHYGTVGASRSKSTFNVQRNSRPPSAGDEIFKSCSNLDYASNNVRTKSDGSKYVHAIKKALSKPELIRLKSSTSEENEEKRKSDSQNNKRWSRVSSSSQNSDKVTFSPPKGPWKAFRKFVNTSTSSTPPRSLSHDEIKATIHLRHQSANANNNNSSTDAGFEPQIGDLNNDSRVPCSRSKTFGAMDRGVKSSEASKDAPKRYTNSLLRRFSRKSSRGRAPSQRRKSLPIDNVLRVTPSDSLETSHLSYSQNSKEEASKEMEDMVMASVQNRFDEEQEKKKAEKKSGSIRKRLMSFRKKRSSSQERKTILKQSSETDNAQINKSLSISSPQLSIYSVGPNSKQVY